ncbi:hypothetical protein FA15DRAFT_759970 [Coprinopsis marcescibilis]|uniref:G-protein coupled receptors family 1 profile domain-containing protein n=1 Tax=Coprinopsis marcescibilis TaxID=230819 RepID=A0A5C3KH51_COPMA|nr:hypothetical protein FA15DRAFT_759970 [Coprinopsis marcescibilis]
MASIWTPEYRNEYGLIFAKAQYANYVIAMATVGIQFFMNCYALVIFLETPRDRRDGRALYLISGWLIFTFYTIGACIDMAKIFQNLLEASNGLEYLKTRSSITLLGNLNLIPFLLVFVMGDGLLIYRCYLLLSGGFLWLLVLPVLMYLSVIALNIVSIVLYSRDPAQSTRTATKVLLGSDVLTFLTNVVITSILCYRLVAAQRDLARSMPLAGGRLTVYRTALRILAESALPLAIAGIINAAIALVPISTSNGSITGYTGNPKALFVAFECVAVVYYALQACALAPQIIIFRVTTGRSWAKTNKSSAGSLSRSLAFNHGPQPGESHLSGGFTRKDEEMKAEEHSPDAEVTANVRFKE